MKIKRALILYKKSAYSIYFQHPNSSFNSRGKVSSSELARFRKMHETHFACVAYVERALKDAGIEFRKICRGRVFDPKQYGLVITVGGDGTFLEASHKLKGQLILGVNSDPSWSVGRFCSATSLTFKKVLQRLLEEKQPILEFPRLELNVMGKKINFLNDVLFCHRNPAAMSRYSLVIGKVQEEQKSSGVWVSTAAGSSGAIRSAGGRKLIPTQEIFQYKPRELYLKKNKPYILKGGILPFEKNLEVISMMREGRVFVDGSHLSFPFDFGVVATITRSLYPLRVVSKK
jgi:NAD+ kinase